MRMAFARSVMRMAPASLEGDSRYSFSCEADEPLLHQALQWVGDDRIFYASDLSPTLRGPSRHRPR